jgi:hypothetical protein
METTARAALWVRVLTMLPLPFMAVMAVRGSVVAFAGPLGPPLSLRETPEVTLAVIGALVPLGFALLLWAPVRGVRGLGYLGYSLVLSVGFAVGAVLAVADLTAGGGSAFEIDGLTATLLVGSFLCGACLLPLAHLIVTDWRASRRNEDVDRSSGSLSSRS